MLKFETETERESNSPAIGIFFRQFDSRLIHRIVESNNTDPACDLDITPEVEIGREKRKERGAVAIKVPP